MAMQPEDVQRVLQQRNHHLGLDLADKISKCDSEEEKLQVLTQWLEEDAEDLEREEALAMVDFITHSDLRQRFFRVLNRTHGS